ncbi:MAG: DUF3990 domain-containing protein [Victivallales bacterium]|nr:DUF3990 domain-containing protein [Victivallales bacterium]
MKLYHGSNVMIERVDLSKSRPFKDFGRAFYLSADEQQAWERAMAAMTMWGGRPCVTVFNFDEAIMSSTLLKIKTFDAYTEEWADFIFANRDRRNPPWRHDYDIVYGPIANDKVGEQVALYKGGYINKSRFLLKLKHLKGITFQYAFCKEKSIGMLRKI